MIYIIKITTGDVFGKLTAVKQVENPNVSKNNKKKYWECVCECGNKTIRSATDLRRGRAIQCWDCAHIETGKHKRLDIVGNTFGLLTVDSVEYGVTSNNGKQRTYCNCTCACGNTVRILLETLKRPGLHSCGCGRKISADAFSRKITGEKFGRLTVIEEFKDVTPRRVLCECECGGKIQVLKTDVMYGHTKSCGCLHKQNTSLSNTKDWTGYISEYGVEFLEKDHKNEHGTWMWKCKCPCCGNIFSALPAQVTTGKTSSCGCRNKSKNEMFIEKLLIDHNVTYIPQYKFPDCKDKYELPFDFGIFTDFDTLKLIEYDGEQHFKPVDLFGGESAYEITQMHDKIKTDYCVRNNIELLRIPYTCSADEIEKMVMNII